MQLSIKVEKEGIMILKKILELAEKNNISVSCLEKTLGFGNGTIKKWGESSPSVDKLKKVADYFGVSIEYFLEQEESQHGQSTGHTHRTGGGDMALTYKNIVVVAGEKVDLETLPKEERERLAMEWNRAAARKLNYMEDKTAQCGKKGGTSRAQ